MSGYDLFGVPSGYRTNIVLLVAPYFDKKFVRQIIEKLSPEKIRVVIDDGVQGEELEELKKAASSVPDVKFVLGTASGLVHLKFYYIEFQKISGRGRRRRRFLYGSANATDAAFIGRRNAELIAEVDLTVGEDSELLNYIAELVTAIENGSGKIATKELGPLRNSSTLHFPAFRVNPPGPAPGFDAWLQRGLLAAKYNDAAQFLTVSVILQKHLPRDVVSAVFARRGLLEAGRRNVVRFRYMSEAKDSEIDEVVDEDAERESITTTQWKSRYCIWTHLGHWLSSECYHAHGAGMTLQNGDRRQTKIEELLACGQDENWIKKRRIDFTDALNSIWFELKKYGNPKEYLKGAQDGIDISYYDDRFTKKILADYRLVQGDDFRERYIKGYEFPVVPRFRQDTASWNSFVRSWCESVALEASRKTPRSLIARTVLRTITNTSSDLDPTPEDIRKWLAKSWNVANTGKLIMAYHQTLD